MQFLGIVLLAIVAACVYGIAHDLVTAHVCVEYFTIGHEPVFGTDSPAPRHVAYLADLWAHNASYAAGALGSLVLCAWTLVRRRRAAAGVAIQDRS